VSALQKHEFTVDGPNKVRVTDIIYIRTRQNWLDLAVVLSQYDWPRSKTRKGRASGHSPRDTGDSVTGRRQP